MGRVYRKPRKQLTEAFLDCRGEVASPSKTKFHFVSHSPEKNTAQARDRPVVQQLQSAHATLVWQLGRPQVLVYAPSPNEGSQAQCTRLLDRDYRLGGPRGDP